VSDAKPGATYIEIFFGSGFQLGTSQVGASLHVQSNVIDSQCNSVGYGFGAGSVTLTAMNSSAVDGTFDLLSAQAGHITGSLSASVCTMPGNMQVKISFGWPVSRWR
jgi:hypothetical protein